MFLSLRSIVQKFYVIREHFYVMYDVNLQAYEF
jgi:hypothetical protein